MKGDYGLELTNNSKASWAFSMPRKQTCVMATDVCWKLCYGNGIRYQSKAQKAKRERNFRTVELLLSKGGPELLAQNLVGLIDQVRPSDWLAATITGEETKTPWTLRIHDIGDWHKTSYAEAWLLAAEQRPLCSFWFYTRSFLIGELFDSLTKLASLANCQGWLSIDSQNYEKGLLAYAQHPGIWKLALLQEAPEKLDNVLPKLSIQAKPREVVSFPVHRGRHHVDPIHRPELFVCPAVLGVFKLVSSASQPRPCQSCQFCLP